MNNKNKKEQKRSGGTLALYIIFSIIASIAIWSYITLVENPEVEQSVTNIPITFIGEDTLASNNLLLVDVNTRTLNISFSGKWNAVTRLTNENISATVDLSEIVTKHASSPGTYQLNYTLDYANYISSSGISENRANYSTVTVTVEKSISRNIQVKGTYDVVLPENFRARSLEYSTQTITVSGPQAEVESISYASVYFQRDEVTSSVTAECEVALIDGDGNEVSKEGLTLSQSTVTVPLPVVMEKELPLYVDKIYGKSNSEENTTFIIEPQTVTVYGEAEILSTMDAIQLGTVNTTKLGLTGTQTFGIIPPEGCSIVSGDTTATVTWEVIGLDTRSFAVSNINFTDVTEGYGVTVLGQGAIVLRGTLEDLNAVSPDDIKVTASLAEQGAATGQFDIIASVTVLGFDKVDVIGDYTITVEIELLPEEPEEPDEGQSSSLSDFN
ncbi:MAG: hypothetical protein II425_05510 [Oscillospiraceae bacterium]|nr:hypothetical protein [Oscillospiraceae bacterium]